EHSFSNVVNAIDWQSDVPFDAERNWFGDASGPAEASGNPAGTGAAIVATDGPVGSPAVDYVPWLGSGNDADAGTCFVPGHSGPSAGLPLGAPDDGGSAPPLNAGVVCNPAGNAGEQDAFCDGVSSACPPNPSLPDTDGDGTCDLADYCTTIDPGQTLASKPKS